MLFETQGSDKLSFAWYYYYCTRAPVSLANQSLLDLKFLGFISMPVTDVNGNLFPVPVKRTTAGELFGFQWIIKIGRYLLGLCCRDRCWIKSLL